MCNVYFHTRTLIWPTMWSSWVFLGSIHDTYDYTRTFRWPTMWSSWALWHQDPLASGLIGLGRPSVRGAIRTKLCNKHKTLRNRQNFEKQRKFCNKYKPLRTRQSFDLRNKILQYRHDCAIRIKFCIRHRRWDVYEVYESVCAQFELSMSMYDCVCYGKLWDGWV